MYRMFVLFVLMCVTHADLSQHLLSSVESDTSLLTRSMMNDLKKIPRLSMFSPSMDVMNALLEVPVCFMEAILTQIDQVKRYINTHSMCEISGAASVKISDLQQVKMVGNMQFGSLGIVVENAADLCLYMMTLRRIIRQVEALHVHGHVPPTCVHNVTSVPSQLVGCRPPNYEVGDVEEEPEPEEHRSTPEEKEYKNLKTKSQTQWEDDEEVKRREEMEKQHQTRAYMVKEEKDEQKLRDQSEREERTRRKAKQVLDTTARSVESIGDKEDALPTPIVDKAQSSSSNTAVTLEEAERREQQKAADVQAQQERFRSLRTTRVRSASTATRTKQQQKPAGYGAPQRVPFNTVAASFQPLTQHLEFPSFLQILRSGVQRAGHRIWRHMEHISTSGTVHERSTIMSLLASKYNRNTLYNMTGIEKALYIGSVVLHKVDAFLSALVSHQALCDEKMNAPVSVELRLPPVMGFALNDFRSSCAALLAFKTLMPDSGDMLEIVLPSMKMMKSWQELRQAGFPMLHESATTTSSLISELMEHWPVRGTRRCRIRGIAYSNEALQDVFFSAFEVNIPVPAKAPFMEEPTVKLRAKSALGACVVAQSMVETLTNHNRTDSEWTTTVKRAFEQPAELMSKTVAAIGIGVQVCDMIIRETVHNGGKCPSIPSHIQELATGNNPDRPPRRLPINLVTSLPYAGLSTLLGDSVNDAYSLCVQLHALRAASGHIELGYWHAQHQHAAKR